METNADDRRHLETVLSLAGLSHVPVVSPRHHHVVLNGQRFHYVEWGRPGNPPLLFLHGGNQTARTWDVMCLALSEHYHCIALDQRGHGDSEWSYGHHYAPTDHMQDVAALVDQLGWSWFVLVGMSMGCMNALYYAGHAPHRLAGLVAVDAGPYIAMEGGETIVRFVESNREHDSLEGFIDAALAFNPKRRSALLRHSLRYSVRQTDMGTWVWKSDRRKAFDLERMRAWLSGLEGIVPRITCPLLIVRGAESPVLSEENADRFAGLVPRAHVVSVPDAGHTVQGDNPKGFLAELQPFLTSLGPPFAAGPTVTLS